MAKHYTAISILCPYIHTIFLDELDTRVVTEYDKRNRTMMEYTRGLKKLEVPEKLTLEEAVGIFEIWKGMKVFGSGGY